ncbi:TlpA disulfide reductase family protein [Aureibaculum sp. 2210JD6-5]|uniref:TlpA family protein disulfide reductase n=1 Tax=Aureibaculum sp. 2210JD6-5 TaxID=3103957 RepID=UPI002AAE56A9|nr:TlpA disulfide reductase family protein [Aureibaculum sp. 2210JD6-5]MDY7395468.1 TlpA disulfide reductase family protein [Aureibaculum sp. 2210JD6-5]
MKKLIVLLIALTLFLSCKKEDKKEFFTKGEVTIDGKINNFSSKEASKEITFYSYDFLSSEWAERHTTKIDSSGTFSLKFSIPNSQVIWFRYNNAASIYVEPNSNLKISFDGNTKDAKAFLNSLEFNGMLTAENELIKKYKINTKIDTKTYYDAYNSSKKSPKEVYNFIDSVYYKNQNKYIDDFIIENNPPENIENWLTVEKEIKPITDLLLYAIFDFKPTNKDKKFEDNFPKEYLDKINNLPLFKSESFVNYDIYTTLPDYYNAYLGRVIKDKYTVEWKQADSILYHKEIYNFKENQKLIQILFFDELNNSLKNNDLSFYNTYKKSIDSIFKNTVYENAISEKYAFTKDLIENPILPKKTELLSFSSNDANTFLDEIIKNADGKVIYIDNWATWCGPCKSEFKNGTPELKNKFLDKVEFVYICHLSDKKLWKPTIAQYKVEGKHYFITEEQNKVLKERLNITGYPTYNIIDKNGELLHSGFEFRPSLQKTSTILSELIKK